MLPWNVVAASFAACLSLAAPAVADADVRRAALVIHGVAPRELASLTAKHAADLRAACAELFRENPEGMFRLYVAVGWRENGLQFAPDGTEFGPINLSHGEADAAAARLGKRIKTDSQRVANWQRFRHDRTYCVWVSVEHLANLIRLHGGDVHAALAHHRYGPKADWQQTYGYVPGVMYRYDLAWDSRLPRRLP